jgi:putative ABC transport system permease protein
MLEQITQDIRYAFRLLLRSPGFASAAVLTLGLGIGANTAIFTVVNAVLLRPLPYRQPDRLVTVWQDLRGRGEIADEWATPGNYVDWRREKGIFEDLAVLTGWRPTMTGLGEPEPLVGEQVTHEYFPVLGVSPAAGRSFTPADCVPNAARVAIISDGLWQRRFGGERSAIGRMVTLGGQPHEIVGVLPPGFRPIVAAAADVWRPLRLNTAEPARGAVILRAVARLAPGLTIDRAQTAATTLARQLEAAHPAFNEKTGINLIPLQERVVGDIRPGLLALAGAVAFVLLIACANIANLAMARGSARARELAVRAALGAGRSRVVRLLLTESLLIAVVGGLAGTLIAAWGVDALVAMAPEGTPRIGEIRLDPRVFAFAALVTVSTGVLFGLAPAIQMSRGGSGALKDAGRGTSAAAGGRRFRRMLIAAEVALSLMLLTGGALLMQTFIRLQSVDLGFDAERVLVAQVNPPNTTYDTIEKHRVFYDQVLERAAALPGVRTAALASVLPLSGDSDMGFVIEGRPVPRLPSEQPVTWYRLVSATYFEAMHMRLARGHGFAAGEATLSVVVNETLARRYFPGEDPLGRRIRFEDGDRWFTIVGVAADAKTRGARLEAKVETFIPYWQFTERGMNVILKTAVDPGQLAAPLRQVVYGLDRNVPLSGVTTLEAMVRGSVEQPRFFAQLAAGFAGLALVLAAVGIYGIMAYVVAQRTSEIGVRMALGATAREVFRQVVADGLTIAAMGIGVGAAGSVLAARRLSTLLFGVGPGDPVTLAATAAVLLAVAAAACAIPARRAARVDPMVALRAE